MPNHLMTPLTDYSWGKSKNVFPQINVRRIAAPHTFWRYKIQTAVK